MREGEHAWVGPEARIGPEAWEPALLAAGNALPSSTRSSAARPTTASRSCARRATTPSQDEAMGFCLFNNVAIAARHAQARRGVERVAIVDWDVHHGNGTETVFWEDPSVLFVSLHQDDLYPPGRGAADDIGAASYNVPLPAGTGDAGYLAAWDELVEPALAGFEPELLLISAGQDAAAGDPLGRMSVTTEGFRGLAARAKATDLPLAVVLEGGYSLDHLPFCNLAIVEALAGARAVVCRGSTGAGRAARPPPVRARGHRWSPGGLDRVASVKRRKARAMAEITEQQVIEAAQKLDKPEFNRQDIADALGVEKPDVKKAFTQARKAGYFEKVRDDAENTGIFKLGDKLTAEGV